jgi:sulfate transport system substrate-binding protein
MFTKLARTFTVLSVAGLLVACASPATPTAAPTEAPTVAAATAAATEAPTAAPATEAATTAPTEAPTAAAPVKLTLGAYSTPREALGEIIPAFKAQWKAQTGQDVTFDESYQGSGAQSRAIIGGFEADVTALSLEGDVDSIVKAGLITHDWRTAPNNGIVTNSVVSFAVRKGNPKNIHDWADLAQPGLEILTPDPKTSGGAQWNILALYGAALRGKITGVPANDEAAATKFLVSVLKNVTALDKDARSSITNFETGVGDVAITYENEVKLGQQRGQDYELVLPSSTILIQAPLAVVDTYVDKHGTRAAAEGFVAYLFSKDAQQIFAKFGFRSIDPSVAQATAADFPAIPDLFNVNDVFGGWKTAKPKYFGDNGIYLQAITAAQGQ